MALIKKSGSYIKYFVDNTSPSPIFGKRLEPWPTNVALLIDHVQLVNKKWASYAYCDHVRPTNIN